MAKQLLGKEVTAALNEKIKANVAALKEKGINPTLGIIRVGENGSDISYERGATKRCETLGVECVKFLLPEDVSQEELLATIDKVNKDDSIHGVLLFRPLPKHLDQSVIENALDPAKDVNIDQSIDFGSTAAAFSGGQADYTIEFEPSATALEAENSGYVVASLGVDSGYVPYTAYSAKTSYLNANPNIIQKFTNALQKGMDFVQSHTPEEIAKVIAPQFKETDLATITTIVSRYYEQDTWKSDLIFNEESFNLLQDILENSGELKERVPYEELVTTTFAEKAAH